MRWKKRVAWFQVGSNRLSLLQHDQQRYFSRHYEDTWIRYSVFRPWDICEWQSADGFKGLPGLVGGASHGKIVIEKRWFSG